MTLRSSSYLICVFRAAIYAVANCCVRLIRIHMSPLFTYPWLTTPAIADTETCLQITQEVTRRGLSQLERNRGAN